MARKKSNKFVGVFQIFFSSIKTYFLYLDKCAKLLAFPIFGQLLGLVLIFMCAYYFSVNEENIRNLAPFLESDRNYLLLVLIVIAPFLIIFIKALFDYLIAFSSLNLLFYTVSNKKKTVEIDLKANNEVIKRRLLKYIALMFLLTLILVIPPLIFVAPITWIYLCLSFQVFAMEGDVSAPKAISRSIDMVKGNVIPTIIMLLLCTFTTYVFFPSVFVWAFDKISVVSFMFQMYERLVDRISLDEINDLLSVVNYSIDSIMISRFLAETTIASIVVGFSLPFRCCCFTNMYKLYDSEKIKEYSKESDEIIKRATEKKGKK